ncbi:DNA-binding protein [Plesiocystis pacifica SIR-1]|uniref:DNA-binding protein n=1 Tax=Plesiocystis pacifica SIR-1 TaxID=391625 RepID=A6G8M1_9BACT|nr:DNA-binding protein [Plesiocystis pacifica SIR-1]
MSERMCDEYDIDGARFGRHVRGLRRARGLTQEGLAERADLSADTIRRLENGGFSPSLVTLVKLTRGLELRLSTLIASYEMWLLPAERELADLLVGREEEKVRLALEVLRVLFAFEWPEKK